MISNNRLCSCFLVTGIDEGFKYIHIRGNNENISACPLRKPKEIPEQH